MITTSRLLLALLGLFTIVQLPQSRADGDKPGDLSGPPRLDFVQEAFILPDGSGGFLLTGSAASFDRSGKRDFDFNRGAPLFKSTDLKSWQPIGYCWDRVEEGSKANHTYWKEWSARGEKLDALLSHATTSPKIYQVKDAWFMITAMNDANIILLKSRGGPEGGYQDYSYLASRGGFPSLFFEEDGTPYLVFADGWVAKMSPDLKEMTEDPRLMEPSHPTPGKGRITLGDRGVALYKKGGKYQALAARWTVRDGKPSHDAFLWTADSIYGPYTETTTILPGAGPVTVFKKPDGSYHAVSSKPLDTAPVLFPLP